MYRRPHLPFAGPIKTEESHGSHFAGNGQWIHYMVWWLAAGEVPEWGLTKVPSNIMAFRSGIMYIICWSPIVKKYLSAATANKERPFYPAIVFIEDTEKAQHGAPMVALISAFEQYPKASFLLVGCDYPFLQSGEIGRLVAARLSDRPAICYVNSSGLEEPLIAIYENAVQQKLIEAFSNGKHSLRLLLQSVDALHCVSSSESAIMSVDDRKTYEEIQQKIFQH